jgi:uncharacterized protein with HEPN domain
MRDAAVTALAFASGRTRDDLEADVMLQFALTRALEIIGEAAARMSDETRASYPKIPWNQVVGMRNRLIHGYFDVDLDILWRTVNENLGALIVTLDEIEGDSG